MTDPSPIDASRRRHPSLEPVPQDQFAHPSERAFARLLNLYGFAWSYEPVEFPLEWNELGVPREGISSGLLSARASISSSS